MLIENLNIQDLNETYISYKERVFTFTILNNLDESLGINWSLDTGEDIIEADKLPYIEPDDNLFVYVHYNYTDGDIYDVEAEAFSGSYSDSDAISVTVGDIIAYGLKSLYSYSKERIFGFTILNTMNVAKTVNWTLNTGESIIDATNLIDLIPDESIFVFGQYNYTNTGDYDVNATAISGSITDNTRNIDVTVSS